MAKHNQIARRSKIMIHLTSKTEILIAGKAVDFRKGIDGLVGLCEHELKVNPKNGKLFVFISRDATKIRILAYDGNGYWLMTKRLSNGKFILPKIGEAISNVESVKLREILSGC
jgi:transposase